MKTSVQKQGTYELFETTKGHQILSLNGEEWYALVEGKKGDIIVHSDSDHERKKTQQQGNFYLADFNDDPDFNDLPHLFLQEDEQYLEFILPNGLPTKRDHQKKLIRTNKKVSENKMRDRIKD